MLQDFDLMRPRRRLTVARVLWYLVLAAGIGFLLLAGYVAFYLGVEHY